MRFTRVFMFFALLLAAAVARAQSVRWEAPDSGVSSAVSLVFENCAPDGEPQLPGVPGVSFTRVSESTSTNLINFQRTDLVTLTYLVRGRQNAPVQIPAFQVKTNRGMLPVKAFTVGAPAASLETMASSKLIPERTNLWAGEVFGLTYELSASSRNNPQVNQTFDWNAAPLVAEDWSKPVVSEAIVGGERRVHVTYKTRAVAKTPNTLRLEAASHLLNIQTGTVGFGFLSQPRMEPVSVTSDQPVLEVKPLPPSPAGFSGGVGQFKLVSKIVPEKAAVGEPVTWTLELSGMGNWPDVAGLPARDVSNDFQVVQPKAKRTPIDGKLFDVTLTEDVVLVPTKTGSYTLGPIQFTYFDPKTGSYKTINAPRTTVTITPPGVPQFGAQSKPDSATVPPPTDVAKPDAEEPTLARTKAPLFTPAPPAGIPRDPLAGSDIVATPMSAGTLTLWLTAPFVGVAFFWSWLAIKRARLTDPARPRREARQRIARTLSAIQTTTDDADRAALLLAWQHDTAGLWQIPHAAPPATSLPNPAWVALWREADRALYGAKAALPSDWVARAQEALAAKRVPGFQPLRLFLPQNLFPFAAAVAVAGLVSTTLLHAAAAQKKEPVAAYRAGDFAAAETAWRAAIKTAPTDWIARHNLSLALGQQERAGEAAGHAAAAFVQQPANGSVQWHFALACERAGSAPAALSTFLQAGPGAALARHASPAVWQRLLIVATFGGALALGWMLANSYGRRRIGITWASLAALVLAVVSAGSATAGVLTYGMAADERAVVVARNGLLRSIPTEADTAQKTTTLAAGSMAIADSAFLGWTRLAFENGQTGWVRNEEVVPLWK